MQECYMHILKNKAAQFQAIHGDEKFELKAFYTMNSDDEDEPETCDASLTEHQEQNHMEHPPVRTP